MTTKRQFAAKSKQAMSRPDAKIEKVMGMNISPHAQNRMVERGVSPSDLMCTLKKAEYKGPVENKSSGQSYKQHGKRVTACITPDGKTVKTVFPLDPYVARKYNIKYEPLSNQKRTDPADQKRLKHAQPKTKDVHDSFKSSIPNIQKIMSKRRK